MVNHGSRQHQETIISYLMELETKGYHTVNLHGRSPDGIAIKDNKIYAVEILGFDYIPKTGLDSLSMVREKKENYEPYDGILFKFFKREKKKLSEPEKKARKIVNNFIKEEREKKYGIQS